MKSRILQMALPVLCLLLTACSGAPEQSAGTAAYTADTVPLDLPLTGLTASAAADGKFYLAGLEEEEGELSDGFSFSSTAYEDGSVTFYSGGVGRAVLYRLDPAGGEAVKLAGYAPERGVSAEAIVPASDGSLWVLEKLSGGAEEPDLSSLEGAGGAAVSLEDPAGAGRVWRRLDEGGAELERVDVTDLAGRLGVEEIAATGMDGAGRLYAAAGSSVTALDRELTVLFTCEAQEPVERLVSLADGTVGAVTGGALRPVDPQGQSLGVACPLSGSASKVFAGDGAHSFLYCSGDSLYGWPAAGTAPEKLLSWSGAGIDSSQVAAAAFRPDGQGAALLWDGSVWPAACSLARLSPAGEEELAGRTVLTLATLGMDSETRARVLEFNRSNGEYRIEVRDYSEFNTAGDVSAGLGKLNTEILAGNMPDLLEVSDELPVRQYAARGLLEDLWPYIESDPGLGRESVMERALESAGMDGKLYQVFPRFALETVAGAASAVGERMGWTLEDLRAAMDRQPAGCGVLGANETRDSIFEDMFARGLDSFVDWEAGKAGFDVPAFHAILDFCASFPARAGDGEAADAYTRAARGEQLLLPVYLGDFLSLQIYRTIFGGAATFVGYPGESGSAVSFRIDGGMAMSAACKDKEGAWSFLRQTLLPGGEAAAAQAFPVNRADFERMAQESMEVTYARDEDGNLITGPDGQPLKEGMYMLVIDGQLIMLEPATRADYDQIMALYEAAEGVSGCDGNVWAIAKECAGACFAGDRTVQETARAIQSRVELYLNE